MHQYGEGIGLNTNLSGEIFVITILSGMGLWVVITIVKTCYEHCVEEEVNPMTAVLLDVV